MRLRTLGGLRLEDSSFSRPKPLLLAAYLALEGAKERRFLAELFWLGAANPRRSLNTALHQLRSNEPGVVDSDEVRVWTEVECDAAALLAAVERGEYSLVEELYGGPFLEGHAVEDIGVELEEWIYGTREFVATRAQSGLLRQAEELALRGEFKAASKGAEKAYALATTTDIDAEELERCHLLLVAGGSAVAERVRIEVLEYGISLDIAAEEAQAQLVAAPQAEPVVANNLPAEVSEFVGRARARGELLELLAKPECRLITLVGEGGVGKTRLGLKLAKDLLTEERYRDGVYFVGLDALTDVEQLPVRIAEALDLSLQGQDGPFEQLKRRLAEKRMMVLLDNFEQLIEGAERISDLLAACPELTFIITSRERLNVVEEWVYPVSGLGLPSDEAGFDEVRSAEAVRLFEQRARRADVRFALAPENAESILRICRLVEGSPLGIELAAAWVRLMSPADIAAEIEKNLDFLESPARNVEERHRSLRATFEHSWKLLTPREQEVLRQLSVFRGGFRREAAAEVVGASIPVLASLVDKSLMRLIEGGRYDRHPLVYQYTEEKLALFPEEKDRAQKRHAAYFLALAEEAEPLLTRIGEEVWLERLDEEQDNVRAALFWADEAGEVEVSLRLTGALWRYWFFRGGGLTEGREYLRKSLDQPAATDLERARAKALYGAAWLAWMQSNFEEAHDLGEETLTLSRKLGDKRRVADALYILASTLQRFGDVREALDYAEEAVALCRESGDPSLGEKLNGLGVARIQLCDYALGQSLLEESLELAREVGDWWLVSLSLHDLGRATMTQGDYDTALKCFEEFGALHEPKKAAHLTFFYEGLGRLAYLRCEYDRAHSYLEKSRTLCLEVGNRFVLGRLLHTWGNVYLCQGEVVTAQSRYQESLKIRRELGDRIGTSELLTELAHLAYLEGDDAKAKAFLDESLDLAEQDRHRRCVAAARHVRGLVHLGEEDFQKARSLLEKSLAIFREIGVRRGIATALHSLGVLASAQHDAEEAYSRLAEALRIRCELGDKRAVAESLEVLASMAVLQGNHHLAACLWGAAAAIRETIGAPHLLSERSRFESELKAVKTQLDEAAFEAAWEEGRGMKLEEAVAVAMSAT